MRFGCCLPGASFVPQMNEQKQEQDALTVLKQGVDTVFALGYDFAELTVGTVTGMTQAEFDGFAAFLAASGHKIEAFNSFVPPSIPLIGDAVNEQAVIGHLTLSAERVKAVGGEIIVFGSGGARRIPDGVGAAQAKDQMLHFLGLCQQYMAPAGITVCIEPLNQKEANFIHTVAEGYDLCLEADMPNIRLLADCFHMFNENEGYEIIAKAAPQLRHVHIADRDRIVPGYPCENGVDFVAFFKALKDVSYQYRVSTECPFTDLKEQAKVSLAYAKQAWEKA